MCARPRQAAQLLAPRTASSTNWSEVAPFHLGSVSGKSCPMSGRDSAPKMASARAAASDGPQPALLGPAGGPCASPVMVCRSASPAHPHARQRAATAAQAAAVGARHRLSGPRSPDRAGMSTPPRISLYSPCSSLCRSKPWPILKGSTGALHAVLGCRGLQGSSLAPAAGASA